MTTHLNRRSPIKIFILIGDIMDSLLWWILLCILIVSISALSLYFCYALIQDYCYEHKSAAPKNSKLSKYKYEKTDVEDLTTIERDFKRWLPQIEFVNEVEYNLAPPPTPRGSLFRRKGSLLPDIHEDSASLGTQYSVEDIMSDLRDERGERRGSEALARRYSLVTEGMRRNSLSLRKFSLIIDNSRVTSTDTLDCVDPTLIETKREIANLEEDVRKVDQETDGFIGGTKNLRFYEINEKLIRLNIALSDIECTTEELRRRKKEVQGYIKECKEKLENKVQ